MESQVSLSSIISGRDKTLHEKQANKNNDQADFLRVQRRASQLLGTLLTIQSQLENQFLGCLRAKSKNKAGNIVWEP